MGLERLFKLPPNRPMLTLIFDFMTCFDIHKKTFANHSDSRKTETESDPERFVAPLRHNLLCRYSGVNLGAKLIDS